MKSPQPTAKIREPSRAPAARLRVGLGALVLGVLGIVLSIGSGVIFLSTLLFAIPTDIVALVWSIRALRQVRRDPRRYAGIGYAVAGLVAASLAIVVLVGGFAWMYAGLCRDNPQDQLYCP